MDGGNGILGIGSFHPTPKDSLCGAHGWRNGSMHLCHIYCKIKQRIHGDYISNKLIKIVHVYGMDGGNEILPL